MPAHRNGLPSRTARTGHNVALVIATALGACSSSARHAGKPPEGDLRSRPSARAAQQDGASRDWSGPAAKERPAEEADPAERVEGVIATGVYHLPECKLIQDVPMSGRFQFVSGWDAINEQYRPCETCRPGPR